MSNAHFFRYIFQFSFAATSTTIVSGSLAMRCRFPVYCIFSFYAVIVYAFVAHWVWAEDGWLAQLGVHDFAGSGAVSLLGAMNALIGITMLGPRLGRFDGSRQRGPHWRQRQIVKTWHCDDSLYDNVFYNYNSCITYVEIATTSGARFLHLCAGPWQISSRPHRRRSSLGSSCCGGDGSVPGCPAGVGGDQFFSKISRNRKVNLGGKNLGLLSLNRWFIYRFIVLPHIKKKHVFFHCSTMFYQRF